MLGHNLSEVVYYMKTFLKKNLNNRFLACIIIIYVIMLFFSYYLYALVINIYNLNVVLSIIITYYIFIDRLQTKKIIIAYFLRIIPVSIFIIVCILIVPKFTYKEAEGIVLENYKKTSNNFAIAQVNPKRIRAIESPNVFVKYYYLLSLKTEDDIKYYILNPVNGEFVETEKPWNVIEN